MEGNSRKIRARWEDIGLDNDFLFGKVMQDPGLCREMLRRTLPDLAIQRITYVEPQKSIDPDADAKGIRLDIYVRGGDGAVTIFLNANGVMDDVSDGLKAFRDYVAGKGPIDDPYIIRLDKAVKKAKMNRKWKREYMTLYMRDLEISRSEKKRGEKRAGWKADRRAGWKNEKTASRY